MGFRLGAGKAWASPLVQAMEASLEGVRWPFLNAGYHNQRPLGALFTPPLPLWGIGTRTVKPVLRAPLMLAARWSPPFASSCPSYSDSSLLTHQSRHMTYTARDEFGLDWNPCPLSHVFKLHSNLSKNQTLSPLSRSSHAGD